MSYRRFLNSPYWLAVRRRALRRSPGCERCGCRNDLQVHHMAYDALGTEAEYYQLQNLEVLCATCHATQHGLPAPERNWSGPESIGDILSRWAA